MSKMKVEISNNKAPSVAKVNYRELHFQSRDDTTLGYSHTVHSHGARAALACPMQHVNSRTSQDVYLICQFKLTLLGPNVTLKIPLKVSK